MILITIKTSKSRAEELRSFCNSLGLTMLDCPNPMYALDMVDEALTHTSASADRNHEQLEFLGDAVLRLAACEYIDKYHQHLSVGERSALRAHLVSDSWLSQLGFTIGVEQVQKVGAKARGDKAGNATLLAEATEALVGALYKGWGSLKPVHTLLTPHWQVTSHLLLTDPYKGNCKSALQEWSQANSLGLPNYNCDEMSQRHGDTRRFRCTVTLPPDLKAKGWGRSRREAEQVAARAALDQLADIGEETASSSPH